MSSSKHYYGIECTETAGKPKFPARNNPHHHILLFLEGDVIEDVDDHDDMISAELSNSQRNREVFRLVKSSTCNIIQVTAVEELQFGTATLDMIPMMSTQKISLMRNAIK